MQMNVTTLLKIVFYCTVLAKYRTDLGINGGRAGWTKLS